MTTEKRNRLLNVINGKSSPTQSNQSSVSHVSNDNRINIQIENHAPVTEENANSIADKVRDVIDNLKYKGYSFAN